MLCVVSQVWWIPHLLPANATVQSSYAGMGWRCVSFAFLFRDYSDGAFGGNFVPGFLGKRLIAKFGFAVGNVVQGLLFGTLHGVMPFLCDYAVEGFVNYFDYGVQRVAAGVDDGEGAGGSCCLGGWRMGGESGAFYGAGFWVAVMIGGSGQGRWRCLPPRFTLRLTQSAALIWRSLRQLQMAGYHGIAAGSIGPLGNNNPF